jgi:hypothetical protein
MESAGRKLRQERSTAKGAKDAKEKQRLARGVSGLGIFRKLSQRSMVPRYLTLVCFSFAPFASFAVERFLIAVH